MGVSDLILNVLTFLMLIVIAWFSFTDINILITILKQKKKDPSMKFCFNTTGKILYIVSTIIFVLSYIIGIIFIVKAIPNDDLVTLRVCIDVVGLIVFLYSLVISNVILLGNKEMMIGRMLIDYRKMKKINYGIDGKVTFVFAQKEYNFTTQFSDLKKIRAAIKR